MEDLEEFLACFVFFICVVVLLAGLVILVPQFKAIGYKPVHATVIESRVLSPKTDENLKTYKAKVRYSYEVDGKQYESSKVRYYPLIRQWFTDGKGIAEETVSTYGKGVWTTAYYDPDDPSVAVLDSSITMMALGMTIVPLFIGFFVIWLAKGSKEPYYFAPVSKNEGSGNDLQKS
jgi:hypothetical protein